MRPAKVVAIVIGALLALLSLGLLVGGALSLWAHTTQRDGDGYYTSDTERFETTTAALVWDDIDLGTGRGGRGWFPDDVGTARLRVERLDEGQVFVGIARERDVVRYLGDTEHDRVVDLGGDDGPTYERLPGEAEAPPPGDRGLWEASVAGGGEQTLRWDIEGGRWAVVVMAPDGAPGLTVEADAGIRTGWLLPIGIGLLVAALVVAVVAAVLIAFGARRPDVDRPDHAAEPSPADPDRGPPPPA